MTGPPPAALKETLRPVERRRRLAALVLIAPLVLFLAINFLAPVAMLLSHGFIEDALPEAWPETGAALAAWDGPGLPDEHLAALLVEELAASNRSGTLSGVANRLNHDIAGFRSLLFKTADALPLPSDRSPLAALTSIDTRWGEPETWASLRHAAGPLTSFYLLAAIDRRLDAEDRVTAVPPERSVFVDVFIRTFAISAQVTVLCLLLGYPVAYLLATLPERLSHPLLILVLLPFWTSILVRTAAWAVLLQTEGVINDALLWLGVIAEPLALIYNRTGVLVAMTHVLLPFLVLPLYGVMKGIKPDTGRAARSLGAGPVTTFLRVFLPQSMPGIVAGCIIVFVLSLGYYVTPALVGGAGDQMISSFIAFYTSRSLNWGMSAALSMILLVATIVLAGIVARLVGAREMKWG